MTISSNTRKNGPYVGNGSASTFAFTFKVFQAADLKVVKLDTATNVETAIALTTDYTVTLNADQDSNPGGSITLVAGALPTGKNLVITSALANLQPTDLTNQGGFYPEVITDALDRVTILVQQLADQVNRSLKLSVTNTINNAEFAIPPAERADKFLSFDSNGDLAVTQTVGTPRGNWTTGTAYASRDIVVDPSNFNVYICLVAHTATGTTPVKTNAQVSNWSLLVNAEAAGLSAVAAAASAAAADASKVIAQASEAIAVAAKNDALVAKSTTEAAAAAATTAQSNAAASAANAASSQSGAAASAVAAAASASQAAAAAGGGAIKITATDQIADYLVNKIVPGTDIYITRKNIGANENITISAPFAVAYAIALGG